MKILIRTFTGLCVVIVVFVLNIYALDFSKIDPKLRMLMSDPQQYMLYNFQQHGVKKSIDASYINVILKTDATISTLKNEGVEVQAVIGDIVTASMTIDRLPALMELPQVTYIEAPKFFSTHTDISVTEIKAEPYVYQTYNVSGKGVIIGIIDTGIDWHHEDFLKSDGKTRIKYLLDFSDPGDTNGDNKLEGPDAYGGTLYTEQEINNALSGFGTIPENDVVGHGTHVAGCAAGDGSATGNGVLAETYVGVAPDADLIIVKATRVQGSSGIISTDYINALAFIDSVAVILGQPYVVNMSLGGSAGAHDGTSLEEQAIDQLMGSGISGKAVVISAGNEGSDPIHASGMLSSSVTSIETKFKIESYETNSGNYDDYILFEMWYDGSASQSIKLIAPDSTVYGPAEKREEYSKKSDNGAVYINNARDGSNPNNWDNQAIIQIFDFSADKPPKEGEWKIIVSGTSGRFDIWLTYATMNSSDNAVYLSSNIDESILIGNPGSAKNAITVGSYVTKNQWTDLDGNRISPAPKPDLYDASSFSSPGPTRDWRTKPEISAPGEWIASSYSQDAPPGSEYSMFNSQSASYPNGFVCWDGKHALAQGTSMSAPHVTGLIALMFEINSNLNTAQIKEALIASARKDQYTLTVPNNKWGYGKLDALAAMQYISGQSQEEKMTVSIFQNPALTQYIDFYLITKQALQSIPTATIQVGSNSPDSIDMIEIESQIYKGEYQFSSEGTATLTIKATIQGESETTITEYFGVKLLKPNLGGIVALDNVDLAVSKNSFPSDTYFTIFPVDKNLMTEEILPVGKAYRFGPSNYSFNQAISLTFQYDDDILHDLDEDKLSIYVFENERWKRLECSIDIYRNIVKTKINRLGIFGLFYDPTAQSIKNKPTTFKLYQNFPNPFNAHTSITYYLPEDAQLTIKIFNMKGELVAILLEGVEQAGFHDVLWNGRNLNNQPTTSGLYFYRFTTDSYSMSRKMLLLK